MDTSKKYVFITSLSRWIEYLFNEDENKSIQTNRNYCIMLSVPYDRFEIDADLKLNGKFEELIQSLASYKNAGRLPRLVQLSRV